MAINMNVPEDYGYDIALLFGVSPSLIAAAKACGVSITPGTGKFTVTGKDGVTLGIIQVKSTAITLAKSGSMGPASKSALKAQFVAALSPAKITATPTADDVFNFAETLQPATPGATYAPVTPVKVPPTVVPLSAAVAVEQPVSGTSSGSVYYVVAVLDGLALAMRSKSGRLSLRAEGVSLSSYEHKLKSLGFNVKPGKYASVHFDVPEVELVYKTVGAVIGGLGFSKVKAMADVTKLVGK